jgi:hypothetical protein
MAISVYSRVGFSRRSNTMRTTSLYTGLILCWLVACGDDPEPGSAGTGGKSGSAGAAANAGASGDAGDAGLPSGGQAGAAGSAGTGATAGTGGGAGTGGTGVVHAGDRPIYGPQDGEQAQSSKLDLVFVIDNSISMADKQSVLDLSVPYLLGELLNPSCLDAAGLPVAGQPSSGSQPCPAGSSRERAPVTDLNVAVITSSLGAHGGQTCSDPTDNDRGRLVPTLERAPGIPSYKGLGFARWAPSDPDAHDSLPLFSASVQQMIGGAGDEGCGYEAPLEAAYRFLVDPAPPLDVVQQNNVSVPTGVDDVVIAQRAAFLRPDSAVQIVVVTDENDCSVTDTGQGWLVGIQSTFLPPATSVCDQDANDPCCQSCGSPARAGCVAPNEDPNCEVLHNRTTDPPNLRCFEQKRRYGVELLYPTQRYAVAFSEAQICPSSSFGDADCACRLAQARDLGAACAPGPAQTNPLFAAGRHPSLVSLAVISGVPWQDIAKTPGDAVRTEYMDSDELESSGRWPMIAGEPLGYVPPSDPFMQESILPRTGQNPVTAEPVLAPASTTRNAINGHEWNVITEDDLQFSCIFPLPAPRDCAVADPNTDCDCNPQDVPGETLLPLCQDPSSGAYGAQQYFGKAYPALRELDVVRYMGARGVLGSICSPNPTNTAQPNYAHHQSMRAILRRLSEVL